MVSYLTTAAYRNSGFGADLSPFSDAELRAILQGAAARVNTYCTTPNLPQPHDFRGGITTDERHVWNINAAQRRVYPWHQPLKSIDSFRILVTNQNYIDIQTTDTVINNSAGYVEIVALTLGIGIFPQIANLGLSVPIASINYHYGSSFPVIGEELFETDGQTFRAANQWWDTAVTPTIYIDGSVSTGNFTIDYNEGTAEHDDTELTAGAVVTADYNYTLAPAIARATGVIATDMIAKSRIAARGLSGLTALRVGPGEVEMRPSVATLPRTSSSGMPDIPDEAAWLLEPFRFHAL